MAKLTLMADGKYVGIFACCLFLASWPGLFHLSRATAAEHADTPNIIFILIDDQGWTDLGTRMDAGENNSMSDYYETPNIDQLAQQSLRFSSGYTPSPICAPSRASYLTGKSPAKLGFTDIPESRPGSRRFSVLYTGKKLIAPQTATGLPEAEVTIAEIIRQRVKEDYATAHFGKWHLGGGGPGRHGFDAHDGSTGNHNYDAHGEDPNPKDVFGVTGRAIAFMRDQTNSGRPFFMQLSHYANHVPLTAMHDTVAKYQAREKGERHKNPVYAALNENLDSSIGRLLEALEEFGIEDNTYIFYTSDNGGSKNLENPSTNNAPLREGKTWVYEGGIRVPFMVKGPGINPGESAVPVIGWDLYPTFCAIVKCEGDLPKGIEGGDLMPLLLGKTEGVERPRGEGLFWHFPHYLSAKGTTPQSAIRVGNYKLVKFYHHEQSMLYDLSSDIGETNNVSKQFPAIASSLNKQLDDYLEDTGAGMPAKNTARSKTYRMSRISVPEPVVNMKLEGKHTSVFSRISYRIPRGWVVTDGESDWLAPSADKQFWETGFDPATDTYYAVSGIPPYLGMEDVREKRVRSLEDIFNATLHSLAVANKAKIIGSPESFRLNGKDAVGFLVSLDGTQSHYQILIKIADNQVATVAGNGPHTRRDTIRDLVTAIAGTIEPVSN